MTAMSPCLSRVTKCMFLNNLLFYFNLQFVIANCNHKHTLRRVTKCMFLNNLLFYFNLQFVIAVQFFGCSCLLLFRLM